MSLPPRVYCYAPQYPAIRAMLEEAGIAPAHHNSLVAVNAGDHLAGIEGGWFIIIDDHSNPVPKEMHNRVVLNGMCCITLSDRYARVKAQAQRAKQMMAGGRRR